MFCVVLSVNLSVKMRELPEMDTETVVLEMCNEMMKYPLNYSLLAAPPPDHSGNSLLHLCAVLNFHRTIRLILQWRFVCSFTAECFVIFH